MALNLCPVYDDHHQSANGVKAKEPLKTLAAYRLKITRYFLGKTWYTRAMGLLPLAIVLLY
jgi:hypothetical protein